MYKGLNILREMKIREIAEEVFKIEAREIENLSNQLTIDFENSVNLILNATGKLIVCGMGKSGIVGKKIAATLASTGTPSFFLHPGEAYHGDLGMIEKNDVVLLISNSGETDEILKLIPFLKSQKNGTISMTGNSTSTLAMNTQFHLNIHIREEACPLQLAPTSSTTATMVMGDALAVALMKMNNFKDVNFARFHPGGSLGRRLLQTVEYVMKSAELPIIEEFSSIKEVISIITSGKCGLVVVLNNDKEIQGVITDGDIRRSMDQYQNTFFNLRAEDIMSKKPKSVFPDTSLVEASDKMNKEKISSLLVVDINNKLKGIVQLYDLGI